MEIDLKVQLKRDYKYYPEEVIEASIPKWRNASWEKCSILIIDKEIFSESAKKQVNDIIKACTENANNAYFSSKMNSKARFNSAFDFISKNKSTPGALFLEKCTDGKYEIVDGSHRVSALLYFMRISNHKSILCKAIVCDSKHESYKSPSLKDLVGEPVTITPL